MADFAAWYRREDYNRLRSLMDDGDRWPSTFDEWERTATSQLAEAKKAGVVIKPIILEPAEFMAYCNAQGLTAKGSRERAMFAVSRGHAQGLN